MSNRLVIRVVKVEDLGADELAINYGFMASDDYASVHRDVYETLEGFYDEFPTKESLIEYVQDLDEFYDLDDSTFVEVTGYNNPRGESK